jgi:hypothetical protein
MKKKIPMTQRELISVISQPTTTRAPVRMQRDNGSEPLVGRFEITRFPSPLFDAGFP